MGVQGLWQLLQPTGRPVTLESLDGKVLAVDVSIWLNQTVKGMRDKHGNPLANAHLLGLFHRVCKLLYYRIKPIFVFDGQAPALKRQTLAARRQRKEDASAGSEKTTKKLVNTLLKRHALKAVLGEGVGADSTPSPSTQSALPPAPASQDIFELPPLPQSEEQSEAAEDASDFWEERMTQRQLLYSELQDPEEIDLESEDFKCLPPEIQHEVLTDLKQTRKENYWTKLEELPEDSHDFSSYQVAKLMKHSKLSRKLEDVRKEINAQNTGDIAASFSQASSTSQVESRKVASDDRAHYILIKGLSKVDKVSISDAESFKRSKTAGSEPMAGTSKAGHTTTMDLDDDIVEIDSIDMHKPKKLGGISRSENVIKESSSDGDNDDDIIEVTSSSRVTTSQHPVHLADLQKALKAMTQPGTVDLTADSRVTSSSPQTVDLTGESGKHCMALDGAIQRRTDLTLTAATAARNSSQTVDLTGEQAVKDNIDGIRQPRSPSENFVISSDSEDSMAGGFIREEEEEGEKTTPEKKTPPSTITKTLNVNLDTKDKLSLISSKSNDHEDLVTKPEESVIVEQSGKQAELKHFPEKDLLGSHDLDRGLSVQKRRTSSDLELDDVKKPKSEEAVTVVDVEPSDSSDDEGFVEVTIDPSKVVPDELFPESMFLPRAETRSAEVPTPASSQPEAEKSSSFSPQKVADLARNFAEIVEEPFSRAKFENAGHDETVQVEETPVSRFTQEDLVEMQADLASEGVELQQKRGQQERLAASITDQMNIEAQEMLQLFGVPFIVSPSEAEAQCAQLELTNQTQGTITDDSDIWLFGGKCIYKNFFNKDRQVEVYRLTDLQSQLLLSRDRMISLALLCGSDYTDGIQGVGPVTAMEILGEFPGDGILGLKNFKEWWDGAQKQKKAPSETKVKGKLRTLQLKDGFPSSAVAEAYLTPTVDESEEPMSWDLPDLDLLRDFAESKFGWSRNKIDEALVPVMKQLRNRQSQASILSYFPTDHSEPRKLKSKRVKRILNRMRTGDSDEAPSQSGPSKPGKGKQPVKGKRSAKTSKPVTPEGGWVKGQRSVTDPVLSESGSSDSEDSQIKGSVTGVKGRSVKGQPTKQKATGQRSQSKVKVKDTARSAKTAKNATNVRRTARSSKTKALKQMAVELSEDSGSSFE